MHQEICSDRASSLVVLADRNKLERIFLESDERDALVDVAKQDEVLERPYRSSVYANVEESYS